MNWLRVLIFLYIHRQLISLVRRFCLLKRKTIIVYCTLTMKCLSQSEEDKKIFLHNVLAIKMYLRCFRKRYQEVGHNKIDYIIIVVL